MLDTQIEVIDLISSPEPEDTAQLASVALARFKPRSQRSSSIFGDTLADNASQVTRLNASSINIHVEKEQKHRNVGRSKSGEHGKFEDSDSHDAPLHDVNGVQRSAKPQIQTQSQPHHHVIPGHPNKRRRLDLPSPSNAQQSRNPSLPAIVPYSAPPVAAAPLFVPRPSRPVPTGELASELYARPAARKGNLSAAPWTSEEDAVIKRLKEDEGKTWDEILRYVPSRTKGAIQVRYSTKIRHQCSDGLKQQKRSTSAGLQTKPFSPMLSARQSRSSSAEVLIKHVAQPLRSRQCRSSSASATRYARLKHTSPAIEVEPVARQRNVIKNEDGQAALETRYEKTSHGHDMSFPKTLSSILRQREIGAQGCRAWTNQPHGITDDLKNKAMTGYTLRHTYQGTSGDIVSVSWAPNGQRLAAGSIAISDDRSMQYNMQRNLLLGDCNNFVLRELNDHHVQRPLITDPRNVNSLHAMQATQDQRLFKTVTATAFSADSTGLHSVGEDAMLRRYDVDCDLTTSSCLYAIPHSSSVTLLTVRDDIVATACDSPSNNINLYRCSAVNYQSMASLSPFRKDHSSTHPLYPTTLRWGDAPSHRTFIAAGYGGKGDDANIGETNIWDVSTGQSFPLHGTTRNVADLAWNPLATTGSIALAVASSPSGIAVNSGIRSVVQCFAPDGRRALIWQCPALDINSVIFCPYDEDLIATAATDGRVYVWDRRSAARSQTPLHILSHGASLNVLPDDRDRELVDEGVQFLSWGATRTRLYSGSSDGIVKVWNPYRAEGHSHVDDIVPSNVQRSAIMSGAFSPDFCDLLVGTENGRINLFSVSAQHSAKPQVFKLHSEVVRPVAGDHRAAAQELLQSGEIELRPAGAMPFRQAVQGLNYKPRALTSALSDAMQNYQSALNKQALLERAHQTSQLDPSAATNIIDDTHDYSIAQAESSVRTAQTGITDIENRISFARKATKKASAFQRSLLRAETDRKQLLDRARKLYMEDITPLYLANDLAGAKAMSKNQLGPCELGCAVHRPSDPHHDDGTPEDDGRATLRVPDNLRRMASGPTAREEVAPCPVCDVRAVARARASGKGRTVAVCDTCLARRLGLTATCGMCGGMARLSSDQSSQSGGRQDILCERCGFACFRCGEMAKVAINGRIIACAACDVDWEAGVLGYQVVGGGHSGRRRLHGQESDQGGALAGGSDDGDEDDVHGDQTWHYASLWEVRRERTA